LRQEVEAAGSTGRQGLAVEGPAWLLQDLDPRGTTRVGGRSSSAAAPVASEHRGPQFGSRIAHGRCRSGTDGQGGGEPLGRAV